MIRHLRNYTAASSGVLYGGLIAGLALLIALVSGAAWASSLYVQSQQSAILAQPQMGAEELKQVERGTELEQLERDGSWFRVSHDGVEGWVSRLTVAGQPPMERQSVLDGDAPDIDNPRRRPSEVASAAAARGLTPEQRERLSDRTGADYQALRRIEEMSIDSDELARFNQALRQVTARQGEDDG
ncbi:SH3 domain-containing protein [Halorhodospira halochloris]|uniref:SH3 domain-containing protein n=1 Tax=Halorhodospira halochloris TaxID=1052 RepID=UPI001EE92065|nr:SH3 domain-containing protein [Halorhodospira halochloris]MCG5547595.1 SH3 domain-containing protein [Halorhodospira halochloris]